MELFIFILYSCIIGLLGYALGRNHEYNYWFDPYDCSKDGPHIRPERIK